MPIVNAAEDGGMRSIEHLMRFVGFRYDNGTTYEFQNHPDDRVMKEFMVREIFFKGYPGVWIDDKGNKVRQGSDASPMTAKTYDNITLGRMHMRGLQDVAKELGAPILSDFDAQILAIQRQQKANDLGMIIHGVTTTLTHEPDEEEEGEEGGEGDESSQEANTSTEDPGAGTSGEAAAPKNANKGGRRPKVN